ncbi:type IV secretion system protein VirB10 [Paucibacter sp. PLA-PC-4]|uniref:type IV secretion system protein VirB10 n=1 Tax=Paucibacter sp. PLA-PC-4 TaxID=2993655 RepID=UPI00224B66EE|nr:type IV secretion system protein VirB10 [Paucibacter sp. PLA-PC-4]MCX2865362.1 type IV secretion system protein VirB10 [Paucibacter sp. PLA-PC-4]
MNTASTSASDMDRPGKMGGSVVPASPEDRDSESERRAGAGAKPGAQTDDQARIPDVSAPRHPPISWKSVIAVLLLAGTVATITVIAVQRWSSSWFSTAADDGKTGRDRPAAASAEPRKLDLSGAAAPGSPHQAAKQASAGPATASPHRIPALVPTDEELAEPIGVRRTGAAPQPGAGPSAGRPEDAPVMLVTTKPGLGASRVASPLPNESSAGRPLDVRGGEHGTEAGDPMLATERNLQDYQRRLQGLLDQLTQASDLARGQDLAQGATQPGAPSLSSPAYLAPDQSAAGTPPRSQAQGQVPGGQSAAALLGGILPRSATPKAMAAMLGNRSLTLPKGTSFSCALKTRVVTASAGLVSCMVQRHVYGDDGRVLLIERGSHLDGEYRLTTVRPGTVRIPVLWTRVRTPLGVIVDIDSPATGQLGESGIDGHVDKRWSERIGAAMLLSLIDDSVQLIASKQSEEHRSGTVVLSSTTSSTSKLAEKVLDSTINIPPTIYRNQGGIAAIHVARDIDFSGVYELQPSAP